MPYAIVINVPEAKKVCFIAMPFAERFQSVYHHISDAANSLDLIPVRVRSSERQQGINFTDDIVDATRSARLVAAVCSPDEGGRANPNVMYELGQADAMGKPTLILTSDHAALPADLAGRHVLPYSEAELGKEELTLRIRDRMNALLLPMRDNPLTNPACTSIHVAYERHLMFTNPGFWDRFRALLAFAKLAHDQHQQIDTAVTDALLAQATLMYNNTTKPRITGFLAAWQRYEQYYLTTTQPTVYLRLQQRIRKTDGAFEFMKREATPELRRQHLAGCYEFYQALRDRLRGYPGVFKEIADVAQNPGLARKNDSDLVEQAYLLAQRVSRDTKTIVMHSDRLIVNLVEMIRRKGE
jgi:hypothetical protein